MVTCNYIVRLGGEFIALNSKVWQSTGIRQWQPVPMAYPECLKFMPDANITMSEDLDTPADILSTFGNVEGIEEMWDNLQE